MQLRTSLSFPFSFMSLINQAFTGSFAGSISFLSYKFEDGGSYKKVLHSFRTRPNFRQQVLLKGQELAVKHDMFKFYQDINPNPTCFFLSEYLHDRYRFELVGEPNQEMVPFSTDDLQLLQDNLKLQVFLPFYKIDRYIKNIDKYLLSEDETTCLFLADGMMRFFIFTASEFPEFRRFRTILRANEYNPCLITIVKSNYLYEPLPPIQPVYTQNV